METLGSSTKNRCKKILCLVLSAVLVLCLSPAYAMAGYGDQSIQLTDSEGNQYSLTYNTGYSSSDSNSVTITGCSGNPSDISIPETIDGKPVRTIGNFAFQNKTGITSVYIPATVTSIDYDAFSGCRGLKSVTFADGSQLNTIDSGAFSDCTALSNIVIPSGVTSIGSNAFSNCASIKSIVIPAGVSSIDYSTFSGCSGLKSVIFAEGSQLSSIGDFAFQKCTSLESIVIPYRVSSIGSWAFSECSKLKTVSFAEGSRLSYIGNYAFYNCTSLSSIEIPSGVATIEDTAFGGCTSLASIRIPENTQYNPPSYPPSPTVIRGEGGTLWTRLSGDTRYGTMQAIVKRGFADHSANTIIVASGENFPDALAATSLAGVLDAPIVLTSGSQLSSEAGSEISRLANDNAKVYILGGNAAISTTVENQIRWRVGSVERLYGNDRIDTLLSIYNAGKGKWGDTAIVVDLYNYPDALSIGAYAACNNAPIFGTADGGGLRYDEVQAINLGGFDKVLVVGGPAAVDFNDVNAMLRDGIEISRLYGQTRYETSAQVVEWSCGINSHDVPFSPATPLKLDGMAVASGANFPDALAGVDLLQKNVSPLLLVDESESTYANIRNVINKNKDSIRNAYILGGNAAISQNLQTMLEDATK